MRKFFLLPLFWFTLIFNSFLFNSCENILINGNSSDADTVRKNNSSIIFTGSISLTGALPDSLSDAVFNFESRSALPALKTDNYCYFVEVTKPGDSEPTYSKNSSENSDDFVINTSGTAFVLSLSEGSWTITAGIKAITAGTVGDDALMSDSFTTSITPSQSVVNHTFLAKPTQTGESGYIELGISPSGFINLTTSCSNNNWKHSNDDDGNIELGSSGSSKVLRTKFGKSIPSGTYEVTINFYDSDWILVYSTIQNINVFDNMTTNKWLDDGTGIINSNGTTYIQLTDELKSNFSRTTFYVGNTSVGTASDTTGTGSAWQPLESVTKAASIIAAKGDSTKDYKIYISGTVTGEQKLNNSLNGKAKSITIEGVNGLDSSRMPKDALNGGFTSATSNNTSRTLLIESCIVPVKIKNLKITGGYCAGNGGGIYIYGNSDSERATLTLESGTLITKNYVTNTSGSNPQGSYGAGIYASWCDCTMKSGAVITQNKTLKDDGLTMLISNGAGIGLRYGTSFVMEGGEISGNEAYGSGGGVYIDGSTAYGSNSFTMKGGTIKENKATYNGGGVYNGMTFSMSGGSISSNSADAGGSGLYTCGTFNISGDASIPVGEDNSNDVALAENKFITVGSLTGESPVALVTPYSFTRGVVYAKADTSLSDITSYKDYFVFTDDSWKAKVSSDKKQLILDSPIYVAGSGRAVCTAAGSASGNGSKTAPFDTIANAITVLTDKNTDYTIYIDGTLTGAQTISALLLTNDGTGTYNAKSVTIQGATGNTTDILNGGFTDTTNGTTLTITSAVPVIIKNLKITGGYASQSSIGGGGLYAKGDVTLSEGALVTGNYTKSCGGGVYNDSKALTIESGAEISSNGEKSSVSGCGGGGIFNYDGILIISGGVIKNNSANHDGGAIYTEGGICYIYGDTLIGKETSAAPADYYYGSNTAQNGGAIYVNGGEVYFGYKNNTPTIDDDADVRVTGNAVKSSDSYGGGIYVKNNDTTDTSGNVYIAKTCVGFNYTPKSGGGIYTKATVNLFEDAVVKGNSAYSYGGGVFVDAGGTLGMTDNSIIGGSETGDANTASSGGGVYVSSSNSSNPAVVLFGASTGSSSQSITGNSATSSGGGVYVDGLGANFTMRSGSVSNNKLVGGITGGGAIGVYYGTLNLQGGVISGNFIENPSSDSIKGGAIDMNTIGKLHLKGTINIPYGGESGKNDVSLRSNPIYLDGAISLPDGKTSVATVVPRLYARGEEIVELSTTPAATISSISPYCDYFEFGEDGWELSVSQDNKKLCLDSPIYVAGTGCSKCTKTGDDSSGNGTKAAPFATIEKACELFNDTGTDYTILIDGTVTGVQTIPDTLKTSSDGTYKAQSLTIRGANGLDSDNQTPKDVLNGNSNGVTLTVNTNVPVTIKNLKITGGKALDNSYGGGMYISAGATVSLGDSSSTWGDYESTVLVTQNTGWEGNGIYSEGNLTLYNCTISNNTSAEDVNDSQYGALYIRKTTSTLTLTGGNLHFGNNCYYNDSVSIDISLGNASSNGSTDFSTKCKITINEALASAFSAVLDGGFSTDWSFGRLNSKQLLTGTGVAASYNKFTLSFTESEAYYYSLDSNGNITQTAK